MKIQTVARYAVFAALLAGLAPAPAEARRGKFIKRRLRQAIVQAVADTVIASVTPGGSTTDAASADAPRAHRTAPASGPAFDEFLLEIKPDLLDRLERALSAEAVERKAVAESKKKILSRQAYGLCVQNILMSSPEGQKAYHEYTTTVQGSGGNMQAIQQASLAMNKRLKELSATRCGPDPSQAEGMRQADFDRIVGAGVTTFGLGERQYAILKERVTPLCAAVDVAAVLSQGYAYAKGEIDALRPRCAKLSALLKA